MDYQQLANQGANVPNQRIIKVEKSPTDKDNYYACINLEAIEEAMYNLRSYYGMKLYIYIAKNQNNHCFRFSSAHFMEYAQCSKKGYTTAFNELVEKGYLTYKCELGSMSNKLYIFTDKSVKKDNEYANHLTIIEYEE